MKDDHSNMRSTSNDGNESQSLSVCASAPGKLILFGEHSVVHGQPAVAAALSDLRIFVLLKTAGKSLTINSGPLTIRVCMPDLPFPIDFSIPVDTFLQQLQDLKAPPTADCTKRIHEFLQNEAAAVSACNILDDFAISAMTPVFYLISHLAPKTVLKESGLEVRVQSKDLPVGAGLGSSAAFSVACSAALVRLCMEGGIDKGMVVPPVTQPTTPDKDHVEKINQFAYYSEIILHGTPSGLDNAVSSHGGAMLYTKNKTNDNEDNKQTKKFSMEHFVLDAHHPLNLIMVNTHVPRSTKKLVASVGTLLRQHPRVVQPILDAMGAIAKIFFTMHSQTGTVPGDTASTMDSISDEHGEHPLLSLIRMNHQLLHALGVSHASLDCVVDVVQRVAQQMDSGDNRVTTNVAAAKLTGAGGGGCAMVVLQPNLPKETVTKVSSQIRTALEKQRDWNFSCFSSTVGGAGVLWIPPSSFPKAKNATTMKRSWYWRFGVATLALAGASALLMAVSRNSRRTSR